MARSMFYPYAVPEWHETPCSRCQQPLVTSLCVQCLRPHWSHCAHCFDPHDVEHGHEYGICTSCEFVERALEVLHPQGNGRPGIVLVHRPSLMGSILRQIHVVQPKPDSPALRMILVPTPKEGSTWAASMASVLGGPSGGEPLNHVLKAGRLRTCRNLLVFPNPVLGRDDQFLLRCQRTIQESYRRTYSMLVLSESYRPPEGIGDSDCRRLHEDIEEDQDTGPFWTAGQRLALFRKWMHGEPDLRRLELEFLLWKLERIPDLDMAIEYIRSHYERKHQSIPRSLERHMEIDRAR